MCFCVFFAQPALLTAALYVAHTLRSLLFCIRGTTPAPPTTDAHAVSSTTSTTHNTAQSLDLGDITGLGWKEEGEHPLSTLWGSECLEREEVVESPSTAASKYFLVSVYNRHCLLRAVCVPHFPLSPSLFLPCVFKKAMAVQQVRFEKDLHSTEDVAHFLDFIFDEVEVESTTDDNIDVVSWTGQVG